MKYFNPNPTCKFFKSGNPKNWYINDSSVRAISKAFDLSWEHSYDKLTMAGKEVHNMPSSKQAVEKVLEHDYEFITLGKPKKGEKRPAVSEFIKEHNKGTYILNLADYYVTVIDGEIYDVSEKCLKSSVYSYWFKK